MNRISAALLSTVYRFVPFDSATSAAMEITGAPGQTVFGDDLNKLDEGSPDWNAMVEYWRKVSDIVEGTQKMRENHIKYLPQFPNETEVDYKFRWENSKFTNVYRDIIEGLAARPFEQEVTLIEPDEGDKGSIPEVIEDFVEDVDGSGNNLTVFAADTFFNGINSALDWIFVDYSAVDPAKTGTRTVAQEQAMGLRPFWTHVLGSNVLEVRSRVMNGKEKIYYIRIVENEPDAKYIRIMRADANQAAWELYREIPGGSVGSVGKFVYVDSGPITIGVIPMVPFITGRRKGRSWQFLPMMRDAADLQIELYQQESGLKNIKTLAGFPMLTGDGVKPEYEGSGNNKKVKTLATGPAAVLYAPPNGQNGNSGSWKFISPEAGIMTFLKSDVEETIKQLRELGRMPLTAQSGNLTVITTAVAAKKANSAVQMWAFGLKDALENAMVLTCMWFNIALEKYDPEVNVFTDFDLDGGIEDLKLLLEARKNGDISQKTLWHEMKRRGILSGEFDPETELEQILEDMVSGEALETDDDDLTEPPPPASE